MAELTIIIPTYNRADLLKKVLLALNTQSYDLKKVEVIVLDDCSSPCPKSKIAKFRPRYQLRFFRMKKHLGQGMVRNEGIKKAHGKYLLFMGDDILPKKNFLGEHMRLHQKTQGIAVLGRVFWANNLRNEFMDYIENIQFHYQTIRNSQDVKLHFYTSNVSLAKSWFKNELYSSKFKNYGLEDLELGYRLEKRGLRVIYNPKAIAYHYHTYDFCQFCKRMENTGRSAVVFVKLHPELTRRYIPYFKKVIKLGSLLLSLGLVRNISKRVFWYSNFVCHYLAGVEDELKNGA